MQKILILLSLCIPLSIYNSYSETATVYATKYKLRIYNGVQDPGLMVNPSDQTTKLPAGMYVRAPGYRWSAEILCSFNLAAIPANAEIDRVDFEYEVENIEGYVTYEAVYEIDREWSGIPQYDIFGQEPWPVNNLLVSEYGTSPGLRSFTDNNNFKSLVQQWKDDPLTNKGIIITNNMGYTEYYMEVTGVRLIIEYTTTGHEEKDFKVVSTLSQYAVYGTEGVNLSVPNTTVFGNIGSWEGDTPGDINVWYHCDVKGDIYSGGDVSLYYGAEVTGDVTAEGIVTTQSNTVIGGYIRENTPVPHFKIPEKNFTGIMWALYRTVYPGGTFIANPEDTLSGIKAYHHSTVILTPGTHFFKWLDFDNNVRLILDMGPNDVIEIYVEDEIEFGRYFQMSFSGEPNPIAVKIYTGQESDLELHRNGLYYGIIVAPLAGVNIKEYTNIYGSVYAKYVNVKGNVYKPPFLTDMAHSEWAYAPPFMPSNTQYHAVVPPSTDSLLVTPTPDKPYYTVTVNGNPQDVPVALNSDTTLITTKLAGGVNGTVAIYTLEVIKSTDYVIYVDTSSECDLDSLCRGNSWENAHRDLMDAIFEATGLGKEIWVAEGTYTYDRETDINTLLLFPGIEIIGGFKGDETEKTPKGSIYGTILSGDWNRDDDQVSSWPPSSEEDFTYLEDNSACVVTFLFGGKEAISTKIEGFTILGGVAQYDKGLGAIIEKYFSYNTLPPPENYEQAGIYYNSHCYPLYQRGSGAGIYISHSSPTIEKCVIKRNYAEEHGPGMFSRAGPKLLKNCLFEENFSYGGRGGGIYTIFNKQGTIDGCVFDGNEVLDFELYGGAIYVESSELSIVNSVFTRNSGSAVGGAICNRDGNMKITNCTFTGNQTLYEGGCVENISNANTEIVNTILWNTIGNEIKGDSFNVTYSCIEGGYTGTGNISDYPKFIDENNPKGANSRYGNNDDGLRLSGDSPCRDSGTSRDAPQYDLILTYRPYGDSVDIGAYEYEDYSNQSTPFGYLRNGQFIPIERLDILYYLYHWKYIRIYSKSNNARVMRITVQRNEYTEDNNEIYLYLRGKDQFGNYLPNSKEVCIQLIKVDQDAGNLYYQSKTDTWGKYILFVNDTGYQNWENNWAYIIYADNSASSSIHCRLPHSQFK